jgi:thioredoxin-related protein
MNLILRQTLFVLSLFVLSLLAPGLLPVQAAVPASSTVPPPFSRHADDFAQETQAAQKEGKLLAVLFELQDCPNCRQLKAEVLAKNPAGEIERHFRTVSVTVDQPGDITTPRGEKLPRSQWADKVGVFATPALGFFDGKGQLVYRHLGTLSTAEELILLGRYITEQAFEDAPWPDWRATQVDDKAARGKDHEHAHAAHDHDDHSGSLLPPDCH